MSTRRAASWNDSPHFGKRGPNGRRLCLHCGEELSEKRKRFTFCGTECRLAREIICHPTAARWQVKERDHGVCARCGLDCDALDDAIADFGITYESNGRSRTGHVWPMHGRQSQLAVEWLTSQGFVQVGYGWKSTWEAHHKTAVVLGGGGVGIDGYETLCKWCHQRETRELHGNLADERRGRQRLPI